MHPQIAPCTLPIYSNNKWLKKRAHTGCTFRTLPLQPPPPPKKKNTKKNKKTKKQQQQKNTTVVPQVPQRVANKPQSYTPDTCRLPPPKPPLPDHLSPALPAPTTARGVVAVPQTLPAHLNISTTHFSV